MRVNHYASIFSVALLFVTSTPALAAVVQYDFSASLSLEIRGDQLATPDQQFFALGDTISGSFGYDNALVDSVFVPGLGNFFAALSDVSGSINGNGFFDAQGVVGVGNDSFGDPNQGLIDLLVLSTMGDGTDSPLSGFQIDNNATVFELVSVRFFWLETTEDLVGDDLPDVLPPGVGLARMALDFQDITNATNTHTIFADPLMVSQVPLPAAAWLLLSGLGVLGAVRRRSV